MEATKKTLHPLLTAAAVSVTVFSAVGVAALTGVLPHSRGSDAPPALHEAAIEHAVSMPAAAPAAQVAPEPVAKPKPKPRPVAHAGSPQVAQAPAAVEAPKPVDAPRAVVEPHGPVVEPQKPAPIIGTTGVIESVRQVEKKGDTSPIGPVAGGVAGGVLGHQVGSGNTSKVMTVLGAGAGILAGKAIEQKVRATKQWEITVQLDKGGTQTLTSESEPSWHAGDRVRLVDGKLQPV
jgi:outer membrane lipoprotein SlyB